VTGVTSSQSQAALAKERLESAGLGHLATVQLQDYHQVNDQFDHIVSAGVLEHVGEEFWPDYMRKVRSALKPSGKALIHSVVVNDNHFNRYRLKSDFLREHIFPGAMLPSATRFREEAERAGLKVNDAFFFGGDYSITLERWLKKFDDNVGEIRDLGYDEAFIRKWRLYLASSAALFKAGRIDMMQAELTAA
jgi:cyclopropane-fatty-acyl-phospholipid synthase